MVSCLELLTALASSLYLVGLVSGHPGEKPDKREQLQQLSRHHAVAEMNSRGLQACLEQPKVKTRREAAVRRRSATFERLRQERGLKNTPFLHRRNLVDFKNWNSISHNQTGLIDETTPIEELFSSDPSCILAPDNANGPYGVYQQLIRQDVTEGIEGIPMHLELQLLDINNCEPADVLIDIWSCNTTGQYSGVSAAGEGGLSSTYLRGVQKTDADGVVSFGTIFPGHYEGRASHQHVVAHVGAAVLPNGTYAGGRVAHLSQLFFDQGLRDAVEALPPYDTNGIAATPNLEDDYAGYAATAAYDPFLNYVVLGGELGGGLFAWHEIGINTSADWDTYATYASIWAEGGGYDNPSFDYSIVATPPPTNGGA